MVVLARGRVQVAGDVKDLVTQPPGPDRTGRPASRTVGGAVRRGARAAGTGPGAPARPASAAAPPSRRRAGRPIRGRWRNSCSASCGEPGASALRGPELRVGDLRPRSRPAPGRPADGAVRAGVGDRRWPGPSAAASSGLTGSALAARVGAAMLVAAIERHRSRREIRLGAWARRPGRDVCRPLQNTFGFGWPQTYTPPGHPGHAGGPGDHRRLRGAAAGPGVHGRPSASPGPGLGRTRWADGDARAARLRPSPSWPAAGPARSSGRSSRSRRRRAGWPTAGNPGSAPAPR